MHGHPPRRAKLKKHVFVAVVKASSAKPLRAIARSVDAIYWEAAVSTVLQLLPHPPVA